MDLERENSGLATVSDNKAIVNNGNLASGDDILSKIENNGTLVAEHVSVEAVKDVELPSLMPAMVARSSDSCSPLVSSGTASKGKGLRKWRRIKREVTKEGSLNVDNSKLLKRGLSNVEVQPGKTMQFLSEMRQMSAGSASSIHDVVLSPGVFLDGFVMMENKEDNLSTIANVPKMRDYITVSADHVNDMYGAKSSSGKSSTGSVQKAQKGKTMAGTSKKLRAGQVSVEKQNSCSSMESDSRSSNVVLMQDNNYVVSRGRQNGGLTNYAGESDQAHREGNDQFRTSYGSNNGIEFEDVSQRMNQGFEEENREKQESSTDQDPLIESIHMLQSLKEALEKEVQRFREIGNEDILADESRPSEWTSVNSEVNGQSSSGEDDGRRSLHALESEISSLKENVHLMKSNLEEMTALLKLREAEIAELEGILGSRSMKEDMGISSIAIHLDMETEIESIYRQKIEAEVKCLTISKTIQDLRVASVDNLSILEQQTVELKRGAEKLESYREDVCPDETVKLQSNVCKYTLCFLIQLILLVVTIGLLLSESPHSTEVVPT